MKDGEVSKTRRFLEREERKVLEARREDLEEKRVKREGGRNSSQPTASKRRIEASRRKSQEAR